MKVLTLSDIIPPPSHLQMHSHANSKSSMVEEDSPVLKSIIAKATDILPADKSYSCIDSNATFKCPSCIPVYADYTASTRGHSCQTSATSFTDFKSFDGVWRGFEFGPNQPCRPATCVLSATSGCCSLPPAAWSLFSITSVRSYGAAANNGAQDLFRYAQCRSTTRSHSSAVTSHAGALTATL